jgi:hypothetical protein
MQSEDATKLQKAWEEKGSPECGHPGLDVEFYLGSRTGDKVCTTCGESFSPAELKAMGR